MNHARQETFVARYGLTFVQIFLLVAITALAHANTMRNEFVFDDLRVVFQDHLKWTTLDYDNLASVWQKSFHKTRPVALISFALNYYFNQYNVAGYHLVNLAIHLMTGLFLFFLIRATLGLPALRQHQYSLGWVPFLSALLWLVHPVQTQSVTYVVQRMNSMAAMFYVIALFAYVRGRLASRWPLQTVFFGGAVVAGLLALGAKEIALTLPFFLVLYDWYFLQDLGSGWLKKYGLWVGGVIGLLVLAAAIFYLGKDPLSILLAGYGGRDFSLGQRLLTEGRVVVFYLSLLFLPLPGRLNLDHDFVISQSLLAPLSTVFSLALLGVLAVSAVLLARRERLLSFGIIWFLGNLAIESTFIPLEIVFEHRLYLPSMLLILALVASASKYCSNRSVNLVVALTLTLVLAFGTYQRNRIWATELTLWRDCVNKSPNKARVHNNLAVAIKYAGLAPAEEEYHLLETIRLDPFFAEAYNNLGNVRFSQGRFDEAIALYSRAIELNQNVSSWHFNLGDTLVKVWRLQEAAVHLKKAVELDPLDPEARAGFYRVRRMLERNKKNGFDN